MLLFIRNHEWLNFTAGSKFKSFSASMALTETSASKHSHSIDSSEWHFLRPMRIFPNKIVYICHSLDTPLLGHRVNWSSQKPIAISTQIHHEESYSFTSMQMDPRNVVIWLWSNTFELSTYYHLRLKMAKTWHCFNVQDVYFALNEK